MPGRGPPARPAAPTGNAWARPGGGVAAVAGKPSAAIAIPVPAGAAASAADAQLVGSAGSSSGLPRGSAPIDINTRQEVNKIRMQMNPTAKKDRWEHAAAPRRAAPGPARAEAHPPALHPVDGQPSRCYALLRTWSAGIRQIACLGLGTQGPGAQPPPPPPRPPRPYRSSPYGTPKGLRSPMHSPLISDPLKVQGLNLEQGAGWGATTAAQRRGGAACLLWVACCSADLARRQAARTAQAAGWAQQQGASRYSMVRPRGQRERERELGGTDMPGC